MSLVEVLTASMLLVSSGSAALEVWRQVGATLQRSSQLELKSAEMEMLRLASHRLLRQQGADPNLLRPVSGECLLDAGAVASAMDQSLPLPDGFRRQWVDDPEQLGVWQELSVLDGDGSLLLERRVLFSPAAYGLCRS